MVKTMGCKKTNLREKDVLVCPLCYEEADQCDDCCDEPTVNEDWWCYGDGNKHYCDNCWEEHLRKKKKEVKPNSSHD